MATTRYSSRDFELLPLEDCKRYEIIDGELYVSRQPQFGHQVVCNNLGMVLGIWNDSSGLGVVGQAPGLVFAEDDDVAPDLVWVSRERLPQVLGPGGHFYAAPELVVEVLSPGAANIRRDREIKLRLYDRRGVDEYWIVDWEARALDVYRRADGLLVHAATFRQANELTSPLLPGFSCPVSAIFSGLALI